MLPLELVEQICGHLDLDSICALAQTSHFWRHSVSDTPCKKVLEAVCPWFEPQHSHRTSWRECVLEFRRRQKPGAKFCASPRIVTAAEFAESPVIDASSCEHPNNVELLVNPIYTSSHGIQVDLKSTYVKAMTGDEWTSDDERMPDDCTKVISLPHMVVLLAMAQGQERGWYHLIVKFKDSRGLEPDVAKCDMVTGMPSVCVVGNHVFIVVHNDDIWFQGWFVYYVSNGKLITVYIRDGRLPKSVSFYDGLLQFFDGERYHAVQLRMDGVEVSDSVSCENLQIHNATETAVDTFNQYSLVTTKNKPYIYDVSRGLLVSATQEDTKFSVQK